MKHYILGDVIDEISERENNPSTSGYERFVGLEHYVSGNIEINQYGSTTNLNSAMKVFQSGDILVARRNVYLKRASVVYFDGLTSGDSIVLRPKDKTMGRILPYILNMAKFWEYADRYADGTMSKRLSPKVLKSYEFDLPDDDKLQELSDLLWAAVDTKKAYEVLLIKTDELVKAQFIETFGDPATNPYGWPMKNFEEVASIDANMTTDYEKYADYPHIGIDSIEKDTGALIGYRTVKEDNVISGKYVFGPQHIIYSKIRPALNKVALPDFEGLCSADAYPILPKIKICDRAFLAHVMRSEYFLNYALAFSKRSQMPKINRKQLSGFSFPLPPMNLQKEFVEFTKQCDKSRHELQKAITSIDNLIKAIMSSNLEDKED